MKSQKPSRNHVERRIQDWEQRLSALYGTVDEWLNDLEGYSLKRTKSVSMYEGLMEAHHLKPRLLNAADIFKKNKIVATIKPVGLWVVGANGRVDIMTKRQSYILVDIADQFQPPQWTIFALDKTKGTPFNKELFLSIIEEPS